MCDYRSPSLSTHRQQLLRYVNDTFRFPDGAAPEATICAHVRDGAIVDFISNQDDVQSFLVTRCHFIRNSTFLMWLMPPFYHLYRWDLELKYQLQRFSYHLSLLSAGRAFPPSETYWDTSYEESLYWRISIELSEPNGVKRRKALDGLESELPCCWKRSEVLRGG